MEDIYQNLTTEQTDLSVRIFNLVVGRVIDRLLNSLDQNKKEEIEKVFKEGSEKEKLEYLKKIPNYQEIFNEEFEKIGTEVLNQIIKQNSPQ